MRQASALDFVEAFPDKLRTRVGSRGSVPERRTTFIVWPLLEL